MSKVKPTEGENIFKRDKLKRMKKNRQDQQNQRLALEKFPNWQKFSFTDQDKRKTQITNSGY